MTVDNEPSSPHYGRVYVTYTKFHMTGGSYARSDYCPIQAAYTDSISERGSIHVGLAPHARSVPDDPGGSGRGASANQFSTPVVDDGRAASTSRS